MKRSKTSFSLLLSALVILLGALLPRIVSWIVDAVGQNRVNYSQISAVHLEFDAAGISMQEKLTLLTGYVDFVEISPSMAALQTKEVEQLVSDTLEQYVQAGLFPSTLNASAAELHPCLFYASFDPSEDVRSNIFWEAVIMARNGGPYLRLILDDQTGAVCAIDFENADALFSVEDLEPSLQAFCGLYLSGLGENFADYDPQKLLLTSRISAVTENYDGVEIAWSDTAYGTVRLGITVHTSGIYAYIY